MREHSFKHLVYEGPDVRRAHHGEDAASDNCQYRNTCAIKTFLKAHDPGLFQGKDGYDCFLRYLNCLITILTEAVLKTWPSETFGLGLHPLSLNRSVYLLGDPLLFTENMKCRFKLPFISFNTWERTILTIKTGAMTSGAWKRPDRTNRPVFYYRNLVT